MRTFIFVLVLTIAHWGLGAMDFFDFRGVDFYSGTNINFSTQDFSSSKIKEDLGFRIRFSGLTGVFSLGNPFTSFSNFPTVFSEMEGLEDFMDFSKIRYGLSTNLSFKNFPYNMKIFAGSLSYGNSFSRLNSSGLYLSSALKSPVLPTLGLNPMLPGYDSSEKDLSFALCFTSKKNYLPEIHLAFTRGLDFYSSIFKTFVFPSTLTLTAVFNIGNFSYGKDYDDSWFMDERPFLEDHYFSLDGEFYLTYKNFKNFLCGAFIQSPFGGFYKWIRLQGDFLLDNFVLNYAFFVCDSDTINPSGTKVSSNLQFQINPWWKFSINNMKFNTGLFFQDSVKHTDDIKSTVFHEMNFRWDGFWRIKNQTYSANGVFKLSSLDKSWDLNIGAGASFKNKKINTSLSGNYKLEGDKSIVSFSSSFSPRESVLESLSCGANVSIRKDQITSSQIHLSGTIKKRWKKISLSAKMAFVTNFSNKP